MPEIYKTYITAAESYSKMNLHYGTSKWEKNNDAKHAQANTQGTYTQKIMKLIIWKNYT